MDLPNLRASDTMITRAQAADLRQRAERVSVVYVPSAVLLGLLEGVEKGRAVAESLDHCRMCRDCGDGPCCEDCGSDAALAEFRKVVEMMPIDDTPMDVTPEERERIQRRRPNDEL